MFGASDTPPGPASPSSVAAQQPEAAHHAAPTAIFSAVPASLPASTSASSSATQPIAGHAAPAMPYNMATSLPQLGSPQQPSRADSAASASISVLSMPSAGPVCPACPVDYLVPAPSPFVLWYARLAAHTDPRSWHSYSAAEMWASDAGTPSKHTGLLTNACGHISGKDNLRMAADYMQAWHVPA